MSQADMMVYELYYLFSSTMAYIKVLSYYPA